MSEVRNAMDSLGAVKRVIEDDKDTSRNASQLGLILLGFLLAQTAAERKTIVKECDVNALTPNMMKLITHLAEDSKGAVTDYLATIGIVLGGGRNLPQSFAHATHEIMRAAHATHLRSIITSKHSQLLTDDQYFDMLQDALDRRPKPKTE